MDVKAVSAGSVGLSSPVTAMPAISISSEGRSVVADVSASGGLSDAVRTQLIQAVAAVESGVSSPTLRADVLQQVSGLGFYLNNTSDTSWPRWSVLTGLRLYGLNLKAQESAPVAGEQQVAAAVTSTLRELAASKGVSLEQVRAVVAKAKSEVRVPGSAAAAAGEGHHEVQGEGKGQIVEMVA